MAKPKDYIGESLTKLTTVFPVDLYIISNRYVVTGDQSDERNKGYYFCVLEPDVVNAWKEKYPDKDFLYIPNIRECKKNLDLIQEVTDEQMITVLTELVEDYYNYYFQHTSLNFQPLELTEDEQRIVFDENGYITLFKYTDQYPSLVFSKTLIPLVTKSNQKDLSFAFDKYPDDPELLQFLLVFDFSHFQLYMKYLFMPIDSDAKTWGKLYNETE